MKDYRWTLLAFVLAGLLVAGLVIWQLAETTPARWCAAAVAGSPEMTTGCFSVLLKLLELKDHALIGLLTILGITVLSIVVVALKVRLDVNGPGGLSVDIGADKTVVRTDADEVTVPTPPSQGTL